MLTQNQVWQFQHYIRRWYVAYGRHQLPWRLTTNPYHILVSEMMLQQTQVERVIPKYLAFLKAFPSTRILADSSLSEILKLWQGLGYNRRAKFLHQTAQTVEGLYGGNFPNTRELLLTLPGIGPYTASAVSAFSFNNPEIVIETNIRTIFLYHFFPQQNNVSDTQLLPFITETLYYKNPREWYAALMDYGSHLKKTVPNPSRKSKHHTLQSRFEGSARQVRGEILRLLTNNDSLTKPELYSLLQGNKIYFEKALADLAREDMIQEKNGFFALSH